MKQLLLSMGFICFVLLKLNADHTFTSIDGRTLEADIVAVSESTVTIRRNSDGRTFTLNIDQLIPVDVAFIQEWSNQTQADSQALSDDDDEIGKWPRKLKPDNYDITIVKEDSETKTYVYRTPHFEFCSNVKLARKVVREFSQIFESTLLAITELPLDFNPKISEDAFYLTQIFETEEQYMSAGGLPNSGGVYFSENRRIMLPLYSLGVKKSSSSYTLDESKKSDRLAHEITHQVTHDWLGKLPVWVSEGIAEYIESVPYERGAFRFDRFEINEVLRQSNPSLVDLEVLMEIDRSEWNQILSENLRAGSLNYRSAFVLQYYFCHLDLDADGKPRLMYDYLRAIEAGQSQEAAVNILLNGRSYEDLEAAVKKAYKREGIDIQFR